MLHTSRELILTYVRRRGPLLAQGIAYSLLIGVTPLLLLSVAAASLLYQVVPRVQNGLHWRLRNYVPEEVAEPIVYHIESMASGWAGMGVVGVVLLLFVSKGIFDSFGTGLSAVMYGERRRSQWLKHLFSFLLTLLAIVLVIVVSLDSVVINLVISTAKLPRTGWVYQQLANGFSVVLLAIVLHVLYSIFATRKINFAKTLLTSLAVSVLWHVLGHVGKIAVTFFARYRLVYGVFSGAVLFLIWLQIFAHLVLLGGLFITHYGPGDAPEGEDAGPKATAPAGNPPPRGRATGRTKRIERQPHKPPPGPAPS